MTYVGIFLLEVILLYFLSRTLVDKIWHFLNKTSLTTNTKIFLFHLIFLPGTLFHEAAHAIAAVLMGVKVSSISLLPVKEGNGIKLGSVTIETPDLIRHTLIGAAPFVLGITAILFIINYALKENIFLVQWQTAIAIYACLEIGNTMFSSRKDLEAGLKLLLILIFITLGGYLIGIRLNTPAFNFSCGQCLLLVSKTTVLMIAPLFIDIFFITLFKVVEVLLPNN